MHGYGPHQSGVLCVVGIGGIGNQDFISRLQEGKHGVKQSGIGTRGDEDIPLGIDESETLAVLFETVLVVDMGGRHQKGVFIHSFPVFFQIDLAMGKGNVIHLCSPFFVGQPDLPHCGKFCIGGEDFPFVAVRKERSGDGRNNF